MSILDASATIRTARICSGLTLEKLSDGICSIQALNRIEKGKSGVSMSTFDALMQRAQMPYHLLPTFENWEDYECFSIINNASFYVNSWQLDKAYEALKKVEDLGWNHNRIYYQKWLLIYCKMIMRTYNYSHERIVEILHHALSITKKNITYSEISNSILSQAEIELLLLLSYESIFQCDENTCLTIYNQLEAYLNHSHYPDKEREFLIASNALCYSYYLTFYKSCYESAYVLLDKHRDVLIQYGDSTLLFEFTFLMGVCSYKTNHKQEAIKLFWSVLFSSDSINSSFTAFCLNYLINNNINVSDYYDITSLRLKKNYSFEYPSIIDSTSFSNGVFFIDKYNCITFGRLIHELRTRNKISQNEICAGLCSKSKLSKIENDTLTPNAILAEALLQRLGISERQFLFFGGASEKKINDIKSKTMFPNFISIDDYQKYIDSYVALTDEQSDIYKQLYTLSTFFYLDISVQEKIDLLWNAFSLTVNDFDIYQFHKYRFSWVELSILNNIAALYKDIGNPERSLLLFEKILEYKERNELTPLFEYTIYPVTYSKLAKYFYNQKNLDRLIRLNENKDLSLLYSSLHIYSGFTFYLCQAYFDSLDYSNGVYYLNTTCAIRSMTKTDQSTKRLINDIEKRHGIDLSRL